MVGILNPEQIDYVLRAQLIGRIGCYASGRMYVVPVTYVYDGSYIYGLTKEGLKVDMIQTMTNWQCVIIQGEYQELSGEESQHAIRLLSNRMTPLLVSETSIPTYTPDIHHTVTASGQLVTYRIHITEKSGRFEKR